MLAPDRYYDGRRRSRSTGGRPLPNINVVQNTYDYDDPPRSRSRGRYRDEDLVDAVDDVAREIRHTGGRSPSPYMMQQQMQLELARERERSRWELERERERLEYELEHDRQEARQRAETEAQLARTRAEIRALKARLEDDEREGRIGGRKGKDWELERLKEETRRRAEEQRRKDERDKFLLEKEREERTERDREDAAVAAYKKKQDKEKQQRADMLAQLKREEEEKQKKAKEEKEMWRQKLEKEKKEEEEKKKKKEQEIEDELAKRLHKVGFQQNQVDAILDPKKKPGRLPGSTPHNALIISKPTYIRIHRDHIDIETLRYFNLPWEYDQGDSRYVVILQEIDKHETDILFEHTRKLRKGATTLLIEDRGRLKNGEHQFAFVKRRPSASPSRRKHSPKRVSVNFGLFG